MFYKIIFCLYVFGYYSIFLSFTFFFSEKYYDFEYIFQRDMKIKQENTFIE